MTAEPPAVGNTEEIDVLGPNRIKKARSYVVGRTLLLDLLLMGLWVVVSDFLVFRNGTFLAWAAFLLWYPLFFVLAKGKHALQVQTLGIGLVLLLLSLKLAWCGSWLQVASGGLLVLCFAMACSGVPPFLPELFAFAWFVLLGAFSRSFRFRLAGIDKATGAARPLLELQVFLPAVVVILFATLFVLANPDVFDACLTFANESWLGLQRLVVNISFGEALFWLASAGLALGLLYPAGKWLIQEKLSSSATETSELTPQYAAFRNTLVSVTVLFASYLCFEFSTLWFREFPEDFYYAGYAHQGAFWLTVALALATLVLSLIFNPRTCRDARLARLKTLAVGWSLLNFLLSIAVYNRLMIYVGFNGLTRMRVIGFLGITCVVLGFALVFYKILKTRSTIWLIHRQAWLPLAATILYAILPIDWLVNSYNVQQVRSGKSASVVQLVAQPTSAEGVLPWFDLASHPDERIRHGIRAMLAVAALEVLDDSELPTIEADSDSPSPRVWESRLGHSSPWADLPYAFFDSDRSRWLRSRPDWSGSFFSWQGAEQALSARLIRESGLWERYASSSQERVGAINEFFRYAYQWY